MMYLGDVAMYNIWIGLQSNIWHGHNTIGSLVVKGLT